MNSKPHREAAYIVTVTTTADTVGDYRAQQISDLITLQTRITWETDLIGVQCERGLEEVSELQVQQLGTMNPGQNRTRLVFALNQCGEDILASPPLKWVI